ncbi:hypothetical protein [Streptomyces sp. 2P-4]|uniref:hypothetical protein n=1 Tax=Streptomyces sp. 2P-4 TaxID=2931974 RepID=UPI0025421730|nr:hypothetical protein [Streptomyces sp. 2P-4]
MDDDDDVETSPTLYRPATAIRVTPYTDTGAPDLDRAVRFRFDDHPLTATYAYRRRLPPLTAPPFTHPETLPALVGFTAPRDHPDPDTLDALTAHFRTLDAYATVDTWSPDGNGSWLYTLITCWQHVTEDSWPDLDPGTPHRLIAIGKALPAPRPYPWPAPVEWGIQAGHAVVLAAEHVPDPPT